MFNRIGGVLAVAIMLVSGHAQAETPAHGFGLFGGNASYSMDGPSVDYSSSGISIGIDYQFGVANNFSINPFLMSAGERTSGALSSGTTARHDIQGVQGRYWNKESFIGAHIGRYSEVLMNGGTSSSGNGFGFGLVAGWESKTSGLIVSMQLDEAMIAYSDTDVNLRGYRLQVGYRW